MDLGRPGRNALPIYEFECAWCGERFERLVRSGIRKFISPHNKEEKMKGSIWKWFVMVAWMAVFFFSSVAATEAQRIISLEKEGDKILFKNEVSKGSKAEVTVVKYYLAPYKEAGNKICVFFEVALKNISDKPARFKTTVSLPDGESAAAFFPLAGKPPVIKPGASFSQAIPIVFSDQMPQGFTVQVDEVEVE
jgi:hypothetical protein